MQEPAGLEGEAPFLKGACYEMACHLLCCQACNKWPLRRTSIADGRGLRGS